jgi:hypothetical protein
VANDIWHNAIWYYDIIISCCFRLHERKIEEILRQFVKELPPEIVIENAAVIRQGEELKCSIKLVMEFK